MNLERKSGCDVIIMLGMEGEGDEFDSNGVMRPLKTESKGEQGVK